MEIKNHHHCRFCKVKGREYIGISSVVYVDTSVPHECEQSPDKRHDFVPDGQAEEKND